MPLDTEELLSALGVVSNQLRDQCLEVLNEILETNAGGEFKHAP